eukprot:TRINITY_DN2887_c0_g1_i5.p1 TRINITY_DN2887_c0_g1~~TRINITY_DN2887_c0_g1_i5.p1  ORF type:complete len:404 (+),score=81.86 TRINITY_DN2887_c0_g1_i5:179-1390(+)
MDPLSAGVVAGSVAALTGYVIESRTHLIADLEYAYKLMPFIRGQRTHFADKEGYNVARMWQETLAKHENKVSLIFEGRSHTFRQVEMASNRVAHWAMAIGLKKGDVVALLSENMPEYFINWLGMTKIGVKVALINTNIRGKSLMHCLKVSDARTLLLSSGLAEPVTDIQPELTGASISPYCFAGTSDTLPNIDAEISAMPATPIDIGMVRGIGMEDTFGYIYTSGTTGLPKAAVITHAKMWTFGHSFTHAFSLTSDDVIYGSGLPLYHSAGGGLGIGTMLASGAAYVIRRKFSATGFWAEVRETKATVVQYIGELCRYLLSVPPHALDSTNHVRVALGNGLRPDIWAEFQQRFGIPEIGEFYGATEANIGLMNHCRSPESRGAVGRMGALIKRATGVMLARSV